jgi:PadR family transcriptional regulator PadR
MASRRYLNSFELMVMLAVIRQGDEAYGVTIAREIESEVGSEVAFGSVYAALDRLEGKGLLSSTLGDPTPERGGRARRYFRVTDKGLAEARETRKALTRLWSGVREVEGGTA